MSTGIVAIIHPAIKRSPLTPEMTSKLSKRIDDRCAAAAASRAPGKAFPAQGVCGAFIFRKYPQSIFSE